MHMNANGRPEFSELVEAHGREIFAYLWRLLQDADEAEDCLQDTYLRAFLAWERLDGDANFRAWLYRIAGNTARTRLRKKLRTGRLPMEDLSASLEEHAENRLQLQAVRRAVEALPYKQRTSFILRRYQELPYAEIGTILDISKDAARANVHQATKKLRVQFEDAADSGEILLPPLTTPTNEVRSES